MHSARTFVLYGHSRGAAIVNHFEKRNFLKLIVPNSIIQQLEPLDPLQRCKLYVQTAPLRRYLRL